MILNPKLNAYDEKKLIEYLPGDSSQPFSWEEKGLLNITTFDKYPVKYYLINDLLYVSPSLVREGYMSEFKNKLLLIVNWY